MPFVHRTYTGFIEPQVRRPDNHACMTPMAIRHPKTSEYVPSVLKTG